jgi:hypothetical protein
LQVAVVMIFMLSCLRSIEIRVRLTCGVFMPTLFVMIVVLVVFNALWSLLVRPDFSRRLYIPT